MKQTDKYEDILYLPHPVSTRHPQMSLQDRAAQFASFAALSGHEEAVEETARLTEQYVELDENTKESLDARLFCIRQHQMEHPLVQFTYFQPDARKEGGAYLTVCGKVKKINDYERSIYLEDGRVLAMDDIIDMQAEIFSDMDDGFA